MTTVIYTNLNSQDLSKPSDDALDGDYSDKQLQLTHENEIVCEFLLLLSL